MGRDTKFPTINGTGTEDYFCRSYEFDSGPPANFLKNVMPRVVPPLIGYHDTKFTTPYTGLAQRL
ncbi:MAG: DUF2961 domain-containing protein [Terriglobia bacterium]